MEMMDLSVHELYVEIHEENDIFIRQQNDLIVLTVHQVDTLIDFLMIAKNHINSGE